MIRISLLLLIGLTTNFFALAQSFEKCLNINTQDSSQLTSFCLLEDGDLITVSVTRAVPTSSGSAVPGQIYFGPSAIRQQSSDGQQAWEYIIDGGAVNLMDVKVAYNGDVVACGTFIDSLAIEGETYRCSQYNANAFVVCLDKNGDFKWSNSIHPVQYRSSYFHDVALYDGKVYLPYINAAAGPLKTYVMVYDQSGDSIDHIQLSSSSLVVSDFEIDEAGEVYVAGTGGPTDIGGATLGKDSPVFGYLSFIAKLDAQFNQKWSHTFRYITFDFYPRFAFNRDRIAFYVDTMPVPNGIGNHHILKFYDHSGVALRSDSVGPTYFSRMHSYMDVVAVNKGFVYSTLKNFNELSFMHVDEHYAYSELASATLDPASHFPSFHANDSVIYYGHNYWGAQMVLNGTDSLFNDKYLQTFNKLQQALVKFSYENTVLSVESLEQKNFQLYPNPSNGRFVLEIEQPGMNWVILDIHGKWIRKGSIERDRAEIDLSGEATGVYFLRLENGTNIRLLKQ